MPPVRKVSPNRSLRVSSDRAHAALKDLSASGLNMPTGPDDDIPRLPTDITELDDPGLMNLFSALVAWADYVGAQVALAQIDERNSQRALDYAEASATSRHWTGGSGERVAVMKKKVAEDDEVVTAYDALDTHHAYRKLIEVLAANLDRDTQLISRELTRRTASAGSTTRRKDKWSA